MQGGKGVCLGIESLLGNCSWHCSREPLLLSLMVLFLTQSVSAQEVVPMSPSVVLVLKLVSTTHVKPTTGIVISDDGLVLVSADFISANPGSAKVEIVVLDGGTDIPRHGRPAKVVHRSITSGLALLSVEGLKRPGFKLSENALGATGGLHFQAFPPAEYIAKGAEPLWVPVQILENGLGDSTNAGISISPETPLPYISGPIIDDCGYLAGLSLTQGAQSLETDTTPVILFADELSRALESMQINIPRTNCKVPLPQVKASTDLKEDSEAVADISRPQEQELESSETAVPAVKDNIQEAVTEQPPAHAEQRSGAEFGKIVTVKPTDPPSFWRSLPLWLPALGFIILVALMWKGMSFFRRGKNQLQQTPRTHEVNMNPSAGEEPDTAVLEAGSDSNAPKPRSAPVVKHELPDLNALPQGCNGVIMIEGSIGTDTRFKRFCAVDTGQINIVIGRGEVEISIEHPAISRTHARLEGNAELMTLSDLGSNNGTFIRGIPCLKGEVMFIATGDDIFLGDVQFRISVITDQAELS